DSSLCFTTSCWIDAPAWSDIASHYPASVAQQLAQLIAAPVDEASGRIILWHGPTGTGKTTAIRALARAWQPERRLQVVVDPDRVFADSSRLMQVLVDDEERSDARWRVLVVEDADEMLRSDAKERVGQAMSRLLNIGDGILGQGTRVLVLITTNEPLGRLHPALVRPGRCLANVQFRPFTRSEARAWLGDDVPPGAEFTLAELLADEPRASGGEKTGGYL
ncbi:MAG: AAA family ATPase, partial [Pirellulales bacterium]|nr:AAA family ATPase [Pirellulales bacterium]